MMTASLKVLPRIDLRQLILALTLLSVLMTLAFSTYSSYQSQRELLMRRTLEDNRIYAAKLAASTDIFLRASMQRLAYASDEIAANWRDAAQIDVTVKRLQGDTQTFNSVAVVDASGSMRVIAPAHLGKAGMTLHSVGNERNLTDRTPIVSDPFVSSLGRLVVTLSHPITSEGRYLGYVVGSIYLQEMNILHTLLGIHHYRDGSYLYVVDAQGRLIYHQDEVRVGTTVIGNPVIEAVSANHAGSLRVINSQGADMLAGYAPVSYANWGIVAQQPTAIVEGEQWRLTQRVFVNTLPWLALSLALIWYLSRMISKPLSQLAWRARRMEELSARQELEEVRSWYFEAAQLKVSLLAGLDAVNLKISRLSHESQTDQLTGLANRREMDRLLAQWEAASLPFAVVVLDIDHFKRVNDTYGHDVGDVVLKQLAIVMRQHSRSMDLPCRTGGEEFAILLPHSALPAALEVAERLRRAVETHTFDQVGRVTISCGVSAMPATAPSLTAVLKAADVALYEAKRGGRNRTVATPPMGSAGQA